MKKFLQGTHALILKYRVPISGWVFAFAVADIFFRKIKPHSLVDPEQPLGMAGLLLVLAGILLRSWSAGVVHKQRKLAQQGPYALTRHPLYVGSALYTVGMALILDTLELYLAFLALALLVYLPLIAREEKTLAEKFGEEWVAYCRRTAAVYPRHFPPGLRADWSAAQWARNREYMGTVVAITCLILLQVLHRYPL